MDIGNRKLKQSHTGGPPKGAVLFVMLLAAVMILAIAAFRVAANSTKPEPSSGKVTQAPTPSPDALVRGEEKTTAILERVDAQTKTLQVYSVEEKQVLWLTYTSATNIVDKYGKAIVAGQLLPGDILTVEYDKKSSSAYFVGISTEIWEHPYQTGLAVSSAREMVTVGDRNFMYSDALHVYNDTSAVELSYILGQDSVTLRGIGSEVYVIMVERGHGYLTLKEGQDYVGGSILINSQYITQITNDMVLTLKEGKCEVTVENDGLKATLEAMIVRDQTTVLDLTEYVRVPDPVGSVTFKIQPAGAMLFINDQNTFYGEPVELDYGVYNIRVESGGYVSYSGTLRVTAPRRNLRFPCRRQWWRIPGIWGIMAPGAELGRKKIRDLPVRAIRGLLATAGILWITVRIIRKMMTVLTGRTTIIPLLFIRMMKWRFILTAIIWVSQRKERRNLRNF